MRAIEQFYSRERLYVPLTVLTVATQTSPSLPGCTSVILAMGH